MVIGNMRESAEVVVVGGGPGGYAAAFHAADLGKDVALVEQEARLGGTCLLRGCIPSKAMITAAERFHQAKHSDFMGITVKDAIMDMKKMGEWRDGIIKKMTDGLDGLCKGRNIRRYVGRGHFTGPNDLHVSTTGTPTTLGFQQAILALGSLPIMPPIFKRSERVMTSDEALALYHLPKSVLVVGGGYIGIELGSCLAALGTDVTVVEMLDRILPTTEPDLVRVVRKMLEGRGMKFNLESKVMEVKEGKDSVKVTVQPKEGAAWTKEYERVLVAIGRKPNTEDCGLERLGVKVDKGFVVIDEQTCRSSLPHVYAIGDCSGQPMLAHRARRMGIVAAEIIAGHKSAYDNLTVPAVIFSEPEIATCGLSEEEAKKAGYDVKVGRFRFGGHARALTMGATEGMVLVIADAKSEVVLGVRMVGAHVSELIGEATLAIETATVLEDLIATIHVHPTMSESIQEAAESVRGESIHSVRISKPAAKAGAK
jgi:dihydrolipoamide dehydrogenase